MLTVEQVDLGDLALALEDHADDHTWWLDPATGAISPHFGDALDELVNPVTGTAIPIEPLPTPVAYGDMADFVAQLRDPRVRDQLERAIAGRGAFRRFKDALLEHPKLRRAWFAFHDARGERRALEWLVARGLVDAAEAERVLAERPEPSLSHLPGVLDAEGVAMQVARDLRRLYRGRLVALLMTGPWARGGVHPEAELSLVAIIDGLSDRWEEKQRMDRIMWRHSLRHDTVITVLPVTPDEVERPVSPLLEGSLTAAVRVV